VTAAERDAAVPDPTTTIVAAIRGMLRRRAADDVEVRLDSELFDDLMLDSLEVAELSAILEDDFGRDPFSEGLVPRTVGEVIAFYDAC
jgi:acyl carrier protein